MDNLEEAKVGVGTAQQIAPGQNGERGTYVQRVSVVVVVYKRERKSEF